LASTAAAALQGRSPDLGHVPAVEQAKPLVLWLVAAPLAFYITWQLLYFLVVQVGLLGHIHTRYIMLFSLRRTGATSGLTVAAKALL
jgi:hypothetical protein